MTKRSFSILLALALAAGVFSAAPAGAQEGPAAVPAVVNIEDPKGDANYLNNQGTPVPVPGDNVLPVAAGTVSDILKVWFTSDATTVNAHILTVAKPPATTPLFFRVAVDPGTGTNCLWFQASFSSAAAPTNPTAASLRDTCATALGTQPAEIVIQDAEGGGGVTTIKVPRSLYPTFTDGSVLKTPVASTRNFIGGAVTAPQVDDTKPGTDYVITSGGPVAEPEPEPTAEPPGKSDPPGKGKKKGCKKGKGQKKGACPGTPKPPVNACPAYVPGEEGAEAETTIVTEAATEEKPVEVTITAPPGVPEVSAGHVFQNIQVDTMGAEAGLYARYEFPIFEDHDIYLNYADGTEAAHVGGFNPTPVGLLDGTGSGGHSEQGAEQLDGIRSADCAGYTLDMTSFLSEGGDMTLKLWIGEIQNDPAAPGVEQEALSTFFSLLGV